MERCFFKPSNKDQLNKVRELSNELYSMGISFDSGFSVVDGVIDWSLDWSFRVS